MAYSSLVVLALGLGVLAIRPANAQSQPPSMVAHIDVEPHKRALDVSARAVAITTGRVSAELAIERHGKSGNVSTKQSRTLDLDAGESGDIARTSVSFVPGDMLNVRVTLRYDGQTVGQASLAIGDGEPGQ